MGLWDCWILVFWYSGILGFWESGILGLWDSGVLEFWHFGILGFGDSGTLKFLDTVILCSVKIAHCTLLIAHCTYQMISRLVGVDRITLVESNGTEKCAGSLAHCQFRYLWLVKNRNLVNDPAHFPLQNIRREWFDQPLDPAGLERTRQDYGEGDSRELSPGGGRNPGEGATTPSTHQIQTQIT